MLLNLGGHGLGDCLLSLQISHLLKERKIPHVNCISTRAEVFNPLNYIVKELFYVNQVSESYSHENNIIFNKDTQQDLLNKFKCNEITYNVPDLLFHHPLALNYKKYNLNPQLIKKNRALVSLNCNKEKIVYCGLATSTAGYLYPKLRELLISLSESLPDYLIYFPNIKKWDKEVNMGDFSNLPSNVFVHESPLFEDSIDFLKKSEYGIFTCNGPSHIAYNMGIPRLILDPQYNKILWSSRWKEDYEECVPLNLDHKIVTQIVYNNIKHPETSLIDRKILANLIFNNHNNWKEIFYLKF